ncbi:hypothetical protein [Intestinirhabdus alba]|jgi:hypothetical protein|uniref:YcxB family protein n=1 Tax=Intestinirhabdus alba TaxID=2899544 RepID=A0A6L6IJ01_9ENTR|nr:hypothetical protein [Intestinirhabdus alba]MTH44693.1 hypothetical protein [Intestinirhabdus alba]
MDNKQLTLPEDVSFTLNIPGHSLSFAQYLWGARLLRLSLPERRRRFGGMPVFLISAFAIWLIFALLISAIDGHYQFRLSAWALNHEAGGYLFRLRNTEVISVFVGCYTAGVLITRLFFNRQQRRWCRSLYDANEAIRYGYCLQLTEQGAGWTACGRQSFRVFVTWDKVKAVKSKGNIDYLDLGTLGFLWLPADMADYPRPQVLAFIEQHL